MTTVPKLKPESIKEYIFAAIAVFLFTLSVAVRFQDSASIISLFILIGASILMVLAAVAIGKRLGAFDLRRVVHFFAAPMHWLMTSILTSSIVIVCAYLLFNYRATPSILQLFVVFLQIVATIALIHLFFIWLTFFCFMAGKKFVLRFIPLKTFDPYIRFFIAFSLGLYLLMVLYFILAIGNLLIIGPYIIVAATVIFLWQARSEFLRFIFTPKQYALSLHPKTSDHMNAILLIVLTTIGSVYVFLNYSSMALNIDDMLTYFTVPHVFLQYGGYRLFPYYPINEAPHIASYLMIPVLQIYKAAISSMNSYFFIFSAFVLSHIVKKVFPDKPRIILFALVAFITFNMNSYLLHSGRPDIISLFMISLALLLVFFEDNDRREITLYAFAGFFLGTAVALKYNNLFAIPMFIMFSFLGHVPIAKKMQRIAILLLFMVVAFAPWGIHSTIRFGNPLHPFRTLSYSQTYTSYTTEPAIAQQYFDEMQQFTRVISHRTIRSGFEKILLMSFPSDGWITNQLGPILIIIVLMAFIKKPDRRIAIFIAAALVTFLVWEVTATNVLHYIYFILPVLALLYGYYADKFRHSVVPLLLSFLLILNYLIRFNPLSLRMAAFDLAGDKRIVQSLSSSVFMKRAELMNALEKINSRYVLLPFNDATYLPNVHNSDQHIVENISNNTWFRIAIHAQTTDEIISALRSAGITHILMTDNAILSSKTLISSADFPLLHDLQTKLTATLQKTSLALNDGTSYIYEIPGK